jgi:cysteine desulfurase
MNPIYFDYAATTPVDMRVAKKMYQCLTKEGLFGNAASSHRYGRQALEVIEIARAEVAACIHAEPAEIIFTSGATESDNLALKGIAYLYQRKGKHIVTMKTEHKAVLDTCQQLEKEGFRITRLAPQVNGLLDINEFKAALQEDTVLVSIMHVNNETGVVQDIDAIAQLTAERGILFHVDAAQSIGKQLINVQQTPIDLLSLSAHKVYGPKGVGALYLRKKPRVRVAPLIHGGGHEQGMRSGTLVTHQIVGMGEAFSLSQLEHDNEISCISELNALFLQGLQIIPSVKMNVSLTEAVPHIVSLRCEGMLADAILASLPGLAASTASACASQGAGGSHVLRAMGLNDAAVKSTIRFSFGRFTTQTEVITAIDMIKNIFKR